MQAHAGLILIVVQKGAVNRDCGACKFTHFASVMAGSLHDGLPNTLPVVFLGLQRWFEGSDHLPWLAKMLVRPFSTKIKS